LDLNALVNVGIVADVVVGGQGFGFHLASGMPCLSPVYQSRLVSESCFLAFPFHITILQYCSCPIWEVGVHWGQVTDDELSLNSIPFVKSVGHVYMDSTFLHTQLSCKPAVTPSNRPQHQNVRPALPSQASVKG